MEQSNSRTLNHEKRIVQHLLEKVGIQINGQQPWDLQVHNEKLYARLAREGALGFGEAYIDKWWDVERLDIFFEKILRAKIDEQINIPLNYKLKTLFHRFINFQTKKRAKKVAEKHYNLDNTLFQAMLDKRMMYSCGYWKNAQTLEEAQFAKLELICRKLKLQGGEHLLDIGCGWGGLAKFAAENFGVKVTGITISEQQYAYAVNYCRDLPIEIRLQDYRDLNGEYDKIVSVGMFEHVGPLNYSRFMKIVRCILKDDGLFLLHTIGSNVTSALSVDWINKYIFPNGVIPSSELLIEATQKIFIMEDWHNFGADYDKTLMAWHENFLIAWENLKNRYDIRFFRMWIYYLLSCAGAFRARSNQLWQIVFSKNGVLGGYESVR